MKKVESKLNKKLLLQMGYALLFLIFGVVLVLKSDITNNLTRILLGVFFLINAGLQVYLSLDKETTPLFKYNLYIGILECLLGVFMLLNLFHLTNILNIGLGIFIIIEAIGKFIQFILFKKANESYHKIFLASSLLFVFMGVLLFINPFYMIVITRTVGLFILFYTIIELNTLILLKNRTKQIAKLWK